MNPQVRRRWDILERYNPHATLRHHRSRRVQDPRRDLIGGVIYEYALA
jgi:hypothetical protein